MIVDAKAERRLNKEVASIIKRSNISKELSSGMDITYNNLFDNKLLLVSLIHSGMPYSFFDLIQDYTPFTEEDWVGFLDISSKSLQRYKQAAKIFKPLQTEKIFEVAEVTNVGLEVFGNMEKFRLWLETPNFALGKLKPKDLIKDSYGKELVLGELTRINYGILA